MQDYLPASIPLHQRGNATKGSILFLHANSYSALLYSDFIKPLERDYEIISPDLPGHGQSRWSGRITKWEDLADFYIDQLDLDRLSKPLFGMGHSIGGIVTLFMAIKRPDLFSRIILLDPVLPPKHLMAVLRVGRLFSITHMNPLSQSALRRKTTFSSAERAVEHYGQKKVFAGWKPEFIQAYVDTCMYPSENGGVQLACRPELESSIYQSLPPQAWSLPIKVSIPALYMIGSNSDTVDARGIKRLKRISGEDTVKVIEGGHLFPFENPEQSMLAIKEFLVDEN